MRGEEQGEEEVVLRPVLRHQRRRAMCCPGFGSSGNKSTEAVTLQKRITKSIAAADETVPYSLVSARVSQIFSVALQKAVAYNALDFRYTKLAKARAVGGAGAAAQILAQAVNDWDADDDEGVA